MIIKALVLTVLVGILAISSWKGGPAKRKLLPHIECQQPAGYREAYTLQTMSNNHRGIPELSYLENFVQAQRITISDAEERDMEIELDVDNKFYRKSTSAKFDGKVECGHDIWRCRERAFSQLVAFVPPGQHNITIRWQPIDGHSTPIKGKRYTFLWERVWCS